MTQRHESRRSESKEHSERGRKDTSSEKARNLSHKVEEVVVPTQKIFVDELGRVIDEKGNIIPKVIAHDY